MFAWVAIWNGYPLIFADSSRYLNGGILRYLPGESPIFYGIFMIPLHLDGVSLWPVVAGQCLILSYALAAALRALDLFDERSFVVTAAFLALFTSAPWFTAFIMPDIFAPIVVLAMFAMFRGWQRFGRFERLVLAGLALLGLASHVTHIVLGLALGMLFVVLRLAGRRVPLAAVLTLAALPFIALIAVVGMNVAAKGRLVLTRDGPVFLLARTFADGPADAYMRTHCGERRWALCKALDVLPHDSEIFLWSTDRSVWTLGIPGDQLRAEAGQIVSGTLREYPGTMLETAIAAMLRQLVTFQAGVDFKSWPEDATVITVTGVIHRFFPQEFARLMDSRQQSGRLATAMPNLLYSATIVLSLAGLLFLLLRLRDGDLAEFAAVVGAALLVNAAVTGPLAVVAARYQARVVWLLPFAFAVSLMVFQRRRLASAAPGQNRSVEGSV